jgi:hypothetical protein
MIIHHTQLEEITKLRRVAQNHYPAHETWKWACIFDEKRKCSHVLFKYHLLPTHFDLCVSLVDSGHPYVTTRHLTQAVLSKRTHWPRAASNLCCILADVRYARMRAVWVTMSSVVFYVRNTHIVLLLPHAVFRHYISTPFFLNFLMVWSY